jgi:hypothetical protein
VACGYFLKSLQGFQPCGFSWSRHIEGEQTQLQEEGQDGGDAEDEVDAGAEDDDAKADVRDTPWAAGVGDVSLEEEQHKPTVQQLDERRRTA